MQITILGSCRQQPLSKYYTVTNIQEGLTYPHYSKEVIQAIRFCNGSLAVPKELTKSIFRSGLLHNTLLDPVQFAESFATTDVFVIEIASRLCYEYEGYYAHHIAFDDDRYRIRDHTKIHKRELTDAEIEHDILEIKHLLAGKKLLIVPHIYTRSTGKRYELVKLIQAICEKHGIPFLDVSYELGKIHPDTRSIYLPEKVLAHYTKYGESIVADIYRAKIDTL